MFHSPTNCGVEPIYLKDCTEDIQRKYNFNAIGADTAKSEREKYCKEAEQGNALAQYNLGRCYYFGSGVAKDQTKAVEWFQKAAAQGNASAQVILGGCYENGDGVAKDQTKAVEWYKKAAAQGLANAQCSLGACYINGKGIAHDQTKAVEWFQKAAAQGYAGAQFNLGLYYYYGNVATHDQIKAVEWFQKAAAQGLANAQFILGQCYYYGDGIATDRTKAIEWYQKAAAQGYKQAEIALTAEDALNKENNEYLKTLSQGDATAQYNLGMHYYKDGATKDLLKATELFRKSANQGNEAATETLQAIYELQHPSKKAKVKVYNSPWNSSVSQVIDYFNKNLKDPKSLDIIEWSTVTKRNDGNYVVRCKYRAKNSFGGYEIANEIFTLDSSGMIISVVNLNE